MANLRTVQKQLTRQLLLDNGLELFESQGYASTTVDDIVAAAGTTRTTFYLHFKSKADLLLDLMEVVNGILRSPEDVPLPTIVASGRRELVHNWLDRKFDQWEAIRPYIKAANQAAATEPEVDKMIESWFTTTAQSMQAGLDQAERFAPETRRIRCVLAFGQFEYLSQRWFSTGWTVDRGVALETLTDSWCYLLMDD